MTLAFLLRTGILEPDKRKGREERLSDPSWYWVARLEIWLLFLNQFRLQGVLTVPRQQGQQDN